MSEAIAWALIACWAWSTYVWASLADSRYRFAKPTKILALLQIVMAVLFVAISVLQIVLERGGSP